MDLEAVRFSPNTCISKHTMLAPGLELSYQGMAQPPLYTKLAPVAPAPASNGRHLLLSRMLLDSTGSTHRNDMNMVPKHAAARMHAMSHCSKGTAMCSTTMDMICSTRMVSDLLEDRRNLQVCDVLGNHLLPQPSTTVLPRRCLADYGMTLDMASYQS